MSFSCFCFVRLQWCSVPPWLCDKFYNMVCKTPQKLFPTNLSASCPGVAKHRQCSSHTEQASVISKPFYLPHFDVFDCTCDLRCLKNLARSSRSGSNVPSPWRLIYNSLSEWTIPSSAWSPEHLHPRTHSFIQQVFPEHVLLYTNHVLSPGETIRDKNRSSSDHMKNTQEKETNIIG